MSNPVQAMLDANKSSLVIEGAAYRNGGGRYSLENGVTFRWTGAEMLAFQEGGGNFAPHWKQPPAVEQVSA